MKLRMIRILIFCLLAYRIQAQILVPMDLTQTDHLKAYGAAYWALAHGYKIEWLLNYRGGSFLVPYSDGFIRQCIRMGVETTRLDGAATAQIYATIESENMEAVTLEKAPSIAVYSPPNLQPWDDAVTLALTYAEIPYVTLWDEAVLRGELDRFDWLHLHHEDFTGQYGKFYATYHNAPWYIKQQTLFESEAKRLGFSKVSRLKYAVASAVKSYVERGGFLFAMCSATDSYDIALSAGQTDICPERMIGKGAGK